MEFGNSQIACFLLKFFTVSKQKSSDSAALCVTILFKNVLNFIILFEIISLYLYHILNNDSLTRSSWSSYSSSGYTRRELFWNLLLELVFVFRWMQCLGSFFPIVLLLPSMPLFMACGGYLLWNWLWPKLQQHQKTHVGLLFYQLF